MTTMVFDLLAFGADQDVAIAAPHRLPLTYAGLRRQMQETVQTLRRLGIRRNDRVAIILPNGPEMAAAFISIAAGATAAPLNPSYRAEEFEFYLGDLDARGVVIQEGMDSPAIAVAQTLGIPVITLVPYMEEAAGIFTLDGKLAQEPSTDDFAQPDDVALVLHTSGTTSRPKIVPLSQRNICISAQNICTALQLTRTDRCLNIMPLFHIHGLMAAVLASLAAGGSVFCTPGFNALRFFAWLEEAEPTWYTAVPTMHQAILRRAARNQAIIRKVKLRFIRSSSSSLSPQVMQELEEIFQVPVIESYGMTEAAHQMTSNPLPPYPRKPGTVGIAAGPEVAIMDEEGHLLPPGSTGEIVVRGENVTTGYENHPEANTSAFTKGWFRTGDLGVMDEEGYLTISGRLKEIINRAGEKISPQEVEEVLLDHPAVEQAITFPMPHKTLGEDVAAAIVLRENMTVTERELRDFVAQHLADFKVPRRIFFLSEIPKGATGKLQRIGLARELGVG